MLHKIARFIFQRHHREFIENLTGGNTSLPHRALIYFKTEPFYQKKVVESYTHTNSWELVEMVRLLNKKGYIVDVVDRSADTFMPENKYDLFIGLGAGNSGKHFAKYASRLTKATKVLFAAGPEPAFSNQLVEKRYEYFFHRTGVYAPPMRTITDIDFEKFHPHADYFFCIGEKDLFSFKTYKKFRKPIHPVLPSSSPTITFSQRWGSQRDRKKFLCFAGHGFICKGVDLVVEAFLTMPELEVYICGPDNETAFFDVYGDAIEKAPNIHYSGFVGVGTPTFQALSEKCAFTLLHSASEGCATSVTTCLRAGLLPVVNHEVGINVGDFGFLMTDIDKENYVADIIQTCRQASQLSVEDYAMRVERSLKDSEKYTQAGFTKSFTKALQSIITPQQQLEKMAS